MDRAGHSRQDRGGISQTGPSRGLSCKDPTFAFLKWESEVQRGDNLPKATKPTRDKTKTLTQVSGLLSL